MEASQLALVMHSTHCPIAVLQMGRPGESQSSDVWQSAAQTSS
jgi:hypothetical protein